MKNYDFLNFGKLKSLLYILKVISLFFAVIPLFQLYFKGVNASNILVSGNIASVQVTLFVTCMVMLLWIFIEYKAKNKFVLYFEIGLIFSVLVFSIFKSGSYSSYYKFLFIFIIVSYTIEIGKNVGIYIASAASAFILLMDLIMFNELGINKYFENDIALATMFIVVAWTLGFYVKLEKEHIEDLKKYANLDGLTNTYNHRYFHQYLQQECQDSIKDKKHLSLIILDIDHFKIYNDLFGHLQGDEALSIVADTLKENARKGDIVCRYGGEEFCIILPDTDGDKAMEIANEYRLIICNKEFPGQDHMPNKNFTVSIGVSQFTSGVVNHIELIHRADSALYRAKLLHRNRVEMYSSVLDRYMNLDSEICNIKDTLKSLITLITVINSRDNYTYKHIERVVLFCDIMAKHLNLSINDSKNLIYGAYLHDLGKINLSKELLTLKRDFTPEENVEMQKHSRDSAEIIGNIKGFEEVVPIVLQHHERYDGSGYPDGIKGTEINYLSRILALADSFDNMTNTRVYNQRKSIDEAYEEIILYSGTLFDPSIAVEFIKAMQKQEPYILNSKASNK